MVVARLLAQMVPSRAVGLGLLHRCASTHTTAKNVRSSNVEAIVLNEKQFPDMLQDLKDQFPMSLPVYNLMKNKINEVRAWPGMEFVVDSYPKYSVCMARTSLTPNKYPVMYNGPTAMIVSRDKSKLREFLQRDCLLDWDNKITFMDVRKKDDEEVIRERCRELGGLPSLTPDAKLCDESCHYVSFDDLSDASYKYDKLPEKLTLSELKPRHAKLLTKHEKYGAGPDLKRNQDFFEYLLKNGYPSVALLDKNDYPVAHAMQRPENCMGAAYVDPDYRSQGLFKAVLIELIKKIRNNDEKHCWADAAVDNDHSTNTLLKLGGKIYEDELFTTFEYFPKQVAENIKEK